MLRHVDGKLTTILWDSVSEPESLLKKQWNESENRTAAASHFGDKNRDKSWLGVESVPKLREVLSKGWSEGVSKLEKIALRDLASPASVRRRRIRSDQGDEVDMQAVWRGDLSRAWTRTRRQSRTGVRSITLVIDLGASCGTDADQLFWRGASALRLASELVSAGYNVAIYGCSPSRNSAYGKEVDVVQFVEIKGEDSPFDIDRLAALTALPGFFRTSLFAGIAWGCDQANATVCGTLGRHDNSLIAKAIKHMPMIPQNAFIQKDVLSKQDAEQWIESVIQQIESGNLEAA